MKLRHELKRLSYFFFWKVVFSQVASVEIFYFMSSHVCGRLGVKFFFLLRICLIFRSVDSYDD